MSRLICAVVLGLLIVPPTLAQQSLVGTYKHVSHVVDTEGVLAENMGKAPRGYLILTPTHFTAVTTAETRKPGNSMPEKATLFDTLSAWSGRYRIEGSRIVFIVEVSWVESWNGQEKARNWELSGNRLMLTSDPEFSPRSNKMSILLQVWEKVG